QFGTASVSEVRKQFVTFTNNGNAAFVISTLNIPSFCTLSGLTIGDTIQPGGLVIATVTASLDSIGSVSGNIIIQGTTACDTLLSIVATLTTSGTPNTIRVLSTGADFDSTFLTCRMK